jgi:hypothetical protein
MSIFKRFAGLYAAYKARSAWVDYAATCSIGDLLLKEMDNIQAPNNIEVTFTDSKGKATATVTVCRVNGKSPAQQLHEVKQERDALLAGLEEIAACDPFHQSSAGIIARATIAKAKGGAA